MERWSATSPVNGVDSGGLGTGGQVDPAPGQPQCGTQVVNVFEL